MRQVIFNIHGIGVPKRDLEPGEAPYWITLEFFAETVALARDSAHRVAFTFDDGNLSDLEIGAPVLNEAGMTAQFFVLAGRIGIPGSLGEAEIRALQEMGHTIGSHGWDHVDWTGLDAAGRTREIAGAKARLSEICDRPIEAASIPFGSYNAGVLKDLRQARFTTAYSSDGGAVRGRPFPMPRTSLTENTTQADLEAILEGRESPKHRLRRVATTRLKRVI
jgi:peptidoglycan/xylan/chitin deacetylase (PgdA/CDA1 family)